jgi:hypothetical protein
VSSRERYDLAPKGFFRFTRWSHERGEEFARWTAHFDERDVETALVETRTSDGRRQVALFVRGVEHRTEDALRERRRLGRLDEDGKTDA